MVFWRVKATTINAIPARPIVPPTSKSRGFAPVAERNSNFAAAPPPLAEHGGAPADRASLDTPADAPLLLAMGRLHDSKAHDISLQALVALPDAYLWIAGVGPASTMARRQNKVSQIGDSLAWIWVPPSRS